MPNSHSDVWIAGAFAAVVVDFVVYPFDTLKTRIQAPDYEKIFKDARTGAVRKDILFRGLYQGVWSVVFSTIPSSGAFFTTYEAVKQALHDSSTKAGDYTRTSQSRSRLPFTHSLPVPVIHGIASSSAEMVACFILTPAEVLKQNAQLVNSPRGPEKSSGNKISSYANTAAGQRNAIRQVASRFKHRPWRLWSGYTALVGRNLPFTGLQFPLFEYVRTHMIRWRRQRNAAHDTKSSSVARGSGKSKPRSEIKEQLVERAGLTGVSAAMAGMVSSFVTTPIDVVKTRVMLSASENDGAARDGGRSRGREGRGVRTKGMLAVGREICQNEGIRGLFKGGAIRAGWTALSFSLYLSLYEGGRLFLENRRERLEGVERGQREGDL